MPSASSRPARPEQAEAFQVFIANTAVAGSFTARIYVWLTNPADAFAYDAKGAGRDMSRQERPTQELFLRLGATPRIRSSRADTLFRRLRAEPRLETVPPAPLPRLDAVAPVETLVRAD